MNFSDEMTDKSSCVDRNIHCTVESCIYNDCDCELCTAKAINVGPENADTVEETVCGTFKKK